MPDAASHAAPRKELSAPQKAMHKLGLVRDIDLALHLPLRYEDETHIVTLREARDGEVVQVEGISRREACWNMSANKACRLMTEVRES